VLLQFSWWTYLLVRTNNQVADLQREILEQQIGASGDLVTTSMILEKQHKLDDDLHKRWMMILGEGAVFIVLLSIAIVRTRNGFRKEALMAERQKNFLLSVTHELKSPLASIGLQTETLIKRDLPKEKQSMILSHVLEDTERLNSLIGNILLAARIDSHVFSINPQSGNFSEFLELLCAKLAAGVGQHHKITANIEGNIHLDFDNQAAHSIVTNLLENAIKYSPQNSEVSVNLKKESGNVLCSIADQGRGIPSHLKESIFERFYRSGSEETRSTKGTGLGLYISRELADLHGWKINVDDNPGGGTIFTINIVTKN
jgi:signal transduction histidine kinase